jgi:hypothetical protein
MVLRMVEMLIPAPAESSWRFCCRRTLSCCWDCAAGARKAMMSIMMIYFITVIGFLTYFLYIYGGIGDKLHKTGILF